MRAAQWRGIGDEEDGRTWGKRRVVVGVGRVKIAQRSRDVASLPPPLPHSFLLHRQLN